jgi:NRPS condensation-like uncharacterized protein
MHNFETQLQRLRNLTPAKRAALMQMLHRDRIQKEGVRIQHQHDRAGTAWLSVAQQQMFFLEQIAPGLPTYNVPIAVRMKGPLDVNHLQSSMNAVVRRHEILRTSFKVVDGQPVQVISAEVPVQLQVQSLLDIPVDFRLQQAQRLSLDYNNRSFDIEAAPLFRARLVRLDDQDHVALMTFHHLICDAQSLEIFIHEFGSYYDSACRGEELQLPELPLQFADYVTWETAWLQSREAAEQLAYWRKQLKEIENASELPLDFPRPSEPPREGKRIYFQLRSQLSHGLETLARESEVGLMIVFLAAFQILLKVWTNSNSIAIGTPVDGRKRVEFESLIGFLSNALVLRTELSEDIRFVELLKRAQDTVLSAYARQELPFDLLLKNSRLAPDPFRPSLFQTWFVFQTLPRKPRRISSLELEPLQLDYGLSRYDLKLVILAGAQTVDGAFEYNTKLFCSSTVDRLACWLNAILERIAEQPRIKVRELLEWLRTASPEPTTAAIQSA